MFNTPVSFKIFKEEFPEEATRVIELIKEDLRTITFRMDDQNLYEFDSYLMELRRLPIDLDNITRYEFGEDFGIRLKRNMQLYDVTQEELSELLDTSQPNISSYIHGLNIPSLMVVYKISRIFNCSLDEFVFTKHGKQYYRETRFIAPLELIEYLNGITREQFGKYFGSRLKQIMRDRCITQQQLSSIIGISRSNISDYINGLNIPSFMVAYKISRALDCSLDEFVLTED